MLVETRLSPVLLDLAPITQCAPGIRMLTNTRHATTRSGKVSFQVPVGAAAGAF